MYLQPTTADRGALRVIPGSHKNPLHKDLLRIGLRGFKENDSQFLKKSGLCGADIPCYIFESNPGDIITFYEWTWHAAFGGFNDRRTCTFNFFRNPRSSEEKESMRKQVETIQENIKSLGTVGQQYHPWWLDNPEGSTRRARWINWLEEWSFVEAYNN